MTDADLTEPLENGYVKSLGEPQGQEADYEKNFSDGKRIHVRKFESLYKAHWDFFSPILSPIQHLRYDAPELYVLLSTLGLGALGAKFSKDKVKGAVVSGGTGLILSILSLPTTLEAIKSLWETE